MAAGIAPAAFLFYVPLISAILTNGNRFVLNISFALSFRFTYYKPKPKSKNDQKGAAYGPQAAPAAIPRFHAGVYDLNSNFVTAASWTYHANQPFLIFVYRILYLISCQEKTESEKT
jgi:hypothetical protein